MTVTVSEAIRQVRLTRERLPPDKLRTIYNFFEGESYRERQDGMEARREFGIPADAALVGIVARLDPVKALDILFAALSEVRKAVPAVRLLIVGDGPLRDELQDLAGQMGLSESVIFAGFRSDVPRVMWAIDVGVLCSHREGLSTVLLEYMAARKPVVATDVGGNAEVVVDGVTGLLVPAGEVQPLAAALTDVLVHPQRAEAMGEAGRERADAVFSAETIVRRIEALYEELLARKGIAMRAGKGP
jgi:glycosyltransferase involved in cell wall biosynthesis